MEVPGWLRGVRPDRIVAEVVCEAPAAPVVVAVVHRGDDGRLRMATPAGQLGAVEALAGGIAAVYECGCHHRVDAMELERVVELAEATAAPLPVPVADISTTA